MIDTTVDLHADVIDVRDIIARFEDLEGANDARVDTLSEQYPNAEQATCGTCGNSFPDVFPSARCPFEYDHEEIAEMVTLRALLADLDGVGGDEQWRGDWYPITLIDDVYFEDYAQELAEDCGMIQADAQWPYTCIDWERAARDLRMDYSSVEVDGRTYWTR